MAEQAGTGKGSLRMLLLAIPVLLVIAIAVNFGTIAQVARGERTFKGVLLGFGANRFDDMAGFEIPPDSGAEDAKVTIEVFLREGDGCHYPTVIKGAALGEVLDGERVRVVFRNTATEEGMKRFQEAKVGCEQGMAVNGKVKFELKDPSGKGKPRVVYLTADHALGGPTIESDASESDPGAPEAETQSTTTDPLTQIGQIIDQELRDTYDGRGLEFTPDQFRAKMQLAMTIVEQKMEQQAKAKAEAEKSAQ